MEEKDKHDKLMAMLNTKHFRSIKFFRVLVDIVVNAFPHTLYKGVPAEKLTLEQLAAVLRDFTETFGR